MQQLPLIRLALLSTSLLSPAALAMRQCPPEFGEKSDAFWLLGWALLAVFAIAGALLPWLVFRATVQTRRPLLRWGMRIASIPVMLATWILGLGIFFGRFVLAC